MQASIFVTEDKPALRNAFVKRLSGASIESAPSNPAMSC